MGVAWRYTSKSRCGRQVFTVSLRKSKRESASWAWMRVRAQPRRCAIGATKEHPQSVFCCRARRAAPELLASL